MEQQIPIIKYDKPKAKSLFVLFKALELFGVFLLTFGFYGLGCLVHKHFPKIYDGSIFGNNCASYFCVWFLGFFSFLCLIAALGCAVLLGYAIFYLIKKWINANWNLAKRFAEDSDAKEKRLKQQEVNDKKQALEKKKQDRKKWGCCVGDEVEILGNGISIGKQHLGEKREVMKIDSDGAVKINFWDHNHWYRPRNVKVTKKYPIKLATQKLREKQNDN